MKLVLEICSVADAPPRELMCDVDLMEAHGLEKPHSLVPHTEPHHSC